MAFNQVVLVGNITRDIELKNTPGGQSVCSFTIAVKRRFQDVTDFHDCVAWGKEAELISKHFRKGKEILVSGELQKRSFDDSTGNKRWVTEVKVDAFSFTGRKEDDADTGVKTYGGVSAFGDFRDIDSDDELPFK